MSPILLILNRYPVAFGQSRLVTIARHRLTHAQVIEANIYSIANE